MYVQKWWNGVKKKREVTNMYPSSLSSLKKFPIPFSLIPFNTFFTTDAISLSLSLSARENCQMCTLFEHDEWIKVCISGLDCIGSVWIVSVEAGNSVWIGRLDHSVLRKVEGRWYVLKKKFDKFTPYFIINILW